MSVLKQKLLAFGIHLGIGLLVVTGFLLFCWLLVYTPAILGLEGGDRIAFMILGVDLALGPMLTFVVYRKGKRELKRDIAIIVAIQVIAFGYGVWTLCTGRPLYLAYVVEHFQIMTPAEIDPDRIRDRRLAPRLIGGPRPVYVARAEGEDVLRITLEAALGGRDVEHYPEYYRRFDEHLDQVRERAWTLDRVRRETPAAVEPIEQAIQRLGRTESELLIVPIVGHAKRAVVLLDRDSGAILDYVDAVIW